VRPPHINRSQAACTIEDGSAVRIGLAYVRSVGEEEAEAIVALQPFRGLGDLARRAVAKQDVLEALVVAGACDEWGQRRRTLWQLGMTTRGAQTAGGRQLALELEPTAEIPELPEQTQWERMLADYKHTSLSVGVHPLELLRPHLEAQVLTTAELAETPHGSLIEIAGLAIARQRPSTANGIVFMLLEDEHGQANLIVPPPVYEEHRAIVRGEPLLLARGKLERHGRNVNLLVSGLSSLGPLARAAASEAEVTSALPRAHHFGHR
jgi:error-prone DNA polymerase